MEPHVDLGERFVQSDCGGKMDDETGDSLRHRKGGGLRRQSAAMKHTSKVGVGFIPTLAAAGHLLCILSAVGRTGINPAPTADECCNDLIIRLLHFSSPSINAN